MKSKARHAPAAVYEIQVQGKLDESWSSYLAQGSGKLSMTIQTAAGGTQSITVLTGVVTDQPALRGLLCRLWDLNLTLIGVRRIETERIEEADNA